MGGVIHAQLKAAAAQNPVLQLAVDILTTYTDGGGIDICHPNTQAFVDQLVGTVLTQEQATAIKSLALTTRAIELTSQSATLDELA